jgi:RNA polymerase sigma factor (sigma-70 family)
VTFRQNASFRKETSDQTMSHGDEPAVAVQRPTVTTEITRYESGELLRLARDGDRAALDQLVERFTPLVWNVARAQGLGTESAFDAVQTTWVSLLENVQLIRSPEALAGWLVTVTRRNAQRLRMIERRVTLVAPPDLADQPDPAADVDADLVNREQDRCLWENLQKLPPTCRELLRILAVTGHTSHRTVRTVLDMPHGSIGPTRGRCLDKLRALLHNDPRWNPR